MFLGMGGGRAWPSNTAVSARNPRCIHTIAGNRSFLPSISRSPGAMATWVDTLSFSSLSLTSIRTLPFPTYVTYLAGESVAEQLFSG